MEKGGVMTRKDSEKDAERPHYYSQFWLDIAAGRRVIGGPKPGEADAEETEVPEAAPARKVGRNNTDGYRETHASPVIEPEVEEEEEFEPEDQAENAELPDIDFTEDMEEIEPEEEEEIIEETYPEEEPEADEEDFYEEEEEEEDEDWGRRGRKKAKPGRQTRQPAKKPRRESRRGF